MVDSNKQTFRDIYGIAGVWHRSVHFSRTGIGPWGICWIRLWNTSHMLVQAKMMMQFVLQSLVLQRREVLLINKILVRIAWLYYHSWHNKRCHWHTHWPVLIKTDLYWYSGNASKGVKSKKKLERFSTIRAVAVELPGDVAILVIDVSMKVLRIRIRKSWGLAHESYAAAAIVA